MKVITVSKELLNPITLPGMGKSIELPPFDAAEIQEVRTAFGRHKLFVEFTEEPGEQIPVRQIWANPHSPQITLFI